MHHRPREDLILFFCIHTQSAVLKHAEISNLKFREKNESCEFATCCIETASEQCFSFNIRTSMIILHRMVMHWTREVIMPEIVTARSLEFGRDSEAT